MATEPTCLSLVPCWLHLHLRCSFADLFLSESMGCCGEPVDKTSPQELNRIVPFETKAVGQQPSPQPGIQWQQEKQVFQQPIVPSPPPVLQYGHAQPQAMQYDYTTKMQNSIGSQPQWSQSQQFSAFTSPGLPQPSSPTMFGGSEAGKFTRSSTPSTYVANSLNAYSPPIAQPSTVHHSPGMSISDRRTASPTAQISSFVPPLDEGKLSVSIDFGESALLLYNLFLN